MANPPLKDAISNDGSSGHQRVDAVLGALLGTALGDAIGLPYEGLSPRRGRRLLGEPDRMRLVPWLNGGFVSDDTEHSCLVAQAWIAARRRQPDPSQVIDPDRFAEQLARRLRYWLLGLPAGIGRATLWASIRSWLGWSPATSGVRSAGNGPAMRAPILGALSHDEEELYGLVHASTRITHRDPRAEHGAWLIAWASHLNARGVDLNVDPEQFNDPLLRRYGLEASAFAEAIVEVFRSVRLGESTPDYAARQGWSRGVSGYVLYAVPVALHAGLSHPRDLQAAIIDAVRCGGDSDTIAAMAGGIVGARVGRAGCPHDWLEHLVEWPRTVRYMTRLAKTAAEASTPRDARENLKLAAPAIAIRNAIFLTVILGHGLRRLLPPY